MQRPNSKTPFVIIWIGGEALADALATKSRRASRRILSAPEPWRVLESDVCCFVRLFPYRVFFTIERDYVLIIAVAHDKREPGYWKNRLRAKPAQ